MADGSPLSANSYPTRTVAIVKPHALSHRLDIERRITEAGFEITKERQMMFRENDADVEDLFGSRNAISLAEGPVWVYVLERRRAVEVMKTLMGDEDPEVARQLNANSLRALYGTSIDDNVIIGSPDNATAEHQISALFVSSPPFRAAELPDFSGSPSFVGQTGSLRSITSSVLSALNRENGNEGHLVRSSQSPLSGKETATTGRSSKNKSAKGFRARPVPASIATPSIQPRLSRAAALRAGIVQPKVSIWSEAPRQALSKEEHQRTFANVPGHKRADTITVASTAAPAITPRMTRAASLRQGKVDVPPTKPRVRDPETESKTFEGVPGHRRRETLQVASVQAPSVAPRTNRSAALRAEKEKPPPSSYMFRGPATTTSDRTRFSRSSSVSGMTQSSVSNDSLNNSRPASTTFSRPSVTTKVPAPTSRRPSSSAGAIVPASIGKPTIEPRQNKSALLRAKKLESARDGNGKINGRPVFV